MLIPYQVDVPMRRWPIANFAIIGVTVAIFFYELTSPGGWILQLLLVGWRPLGLLGHMWLHAGWLHLIGNMIFLWVFGNAVCAKFGNLAFPFIYIGLGLLAAVTHLVFSGAPALGGSGAINGVVGAFVVLYPLNDISCILLWFPWFPRFSISSYWMILLWLAFDIWGATRGGQGIAYWAHVGGFAAGFGLATVALALRWIRMDEGERSLYRALRHRRVNPADFSRRSPSESLPERQPTTTPDGGPATMGDWIARQEQQAPPAGSSAPAPPPSRPPRPAAGTASSESVRVKCVCGKTLRVPKELCGERARCPACQKVIQIPVV